MPLEAPTSCWTAAHKAIADALAASTALQAIFASRGIAAGDAPLFIFGDQAGRPFDGDSFTAAEIEAIKAQALVASGGDPYGKNRQTVDLFDPAGETVVEIRRLITAAEYEAGDVVDAEGGPAPLEWWFRQRIGELIDQLIQHFDDQGSLYLVEIYVSSGPGLNDRQQQRSIGIWQGVELTLRWGLASA